MKQDYQNQIIWIIGASSGIGRALAGELARRGATLALSARRQDELAALQAELGGAHRSFALDVADVDGVALTAKTIQARFGRIDRIIFLAAAYTPMQTDQMDLAAVRQMIDVNLTSAFYLAHAALPMLKLQGGRPQLALCGSVAGYTGLPGGQPYSATKAGIINLAESLYAEHHRHIDVRLISPGFVRTPLTDKNDFKMPMIITPQQAARAIADGLLSSRFEIHFPKRFTLFLKLLAALPYGLSLRIAATMKS
ncbi:MAG TPA: SDR family NAD(P)-dependent oxidoreductase [Alphaproteobacteria bacterium]|nr:short-chain dehydrogenase [Rhodospirillaceae bacterium]HRJ12583.1 SDR family NAD(P)-dependent oxidoreductase [Alphaproteobacteria bacterium]